MIPFWITMIPIAISMACWAAQMGNLIADKVNEDKKAGKNATKDKRYTPFVPGHGESTLLQAVKGANGICEHPETLWAHGSEIPEENTPTEEEIDAFIASIYDVVVILEEYKATLY